MAWTATHTRHISVLRESTTGNDKSFTVGTELGNKDWQISGVYVDYGANATAGQRTVRLEVQDGSSNIIASYEGGANSAIDPGNTERLNFAAEATTLFAGQVSDSGDPGTQELRQFPMPRMLLQKGSVFRVYDQEDISSNDVLDVTVTVLSLF